LNPNLSYGAVPDGQPFTRQLLYQSTPGARNVSAAAPLFINEWLASNTNNLADPADGDFEDWFELYNAGNSPLDVGGYFLSDTPANPAKFRIPAGYLVPARGFLVVWADEETGQNQLQNADLHVNFRLAAGGERLLLSSPSGDLLDQISFGAQLEDVSEGRYADGAASIFSLAAPTPGAPNRYGNGNTAPQLDPIANQTVTLGQTLRITAHASDAEAPLQTLMFRLDGVVPNGAAMDAVTGVFTWTPSAAQTPSVNPFVMRVTDSGSPALSATRAFTVAVVSPPRLLGMTRPNNGVLSFSLAVIPGKHYRIQYKKNLDDAQWITLEPDRTATGVTLLVEDAPGTDPNRFYRVSVLD
jgi:hypothetical protein